MFKDNLMMLRNTFGLSQEEVAEKIGISRQAYAKWEKGDTIPDIERCKKIADIYGVSMDSLLNETKTDEGQPVLPGPKGKNMWGSVTINDRGQIVIPKVIREKYGLSGGQRLIVLTEDDSGIALIPSDIFEEKMQNAMKFASKKLDG